MDRKPVQNMDSSNPKINFRNSASRWFYYKNISRCTVLWMSNYNFLLKITSYYHIFPESNYSNTPEWSMELPISLVLCNYRHILWGILELTEKCRELNSTIYNTTQKYAENYRLLKIFQDGFRLGYDDVYFDIDWCQRFGGSCWLHIQFVVPFCHNNGGRMCVKHVLNYKIIRQDILEGSDFNVEE